MSMDADDIAALADEYVLGLLDPAEAAHLEDMMARDPELARRIGQLRDGLLPLDMSAPEPALPTDFAARVKSALGPVTPVAANEPQAPRRAWWPAAVAASVGVLAGAVLGWQIKEVDPVVIAVLLDANGTPQAMVEDFGNDTARVRFLADVQVPQGQIMQVWTLPSADTGPVSLGLLPAVGSARLKGPELPPPAGQQLYEITFEPMGGSPTGRPTGPILAKGLAAVQDS